MEFPFQMEITEFATKIFSSSDTLNARKNFKKNYYAISAENSTNLDAQFFRLQ